LNLDADLVVLSSCESGVGKLVKGEGLVALTRGFFYSGARNIVFSLWKVPDKHTSDLMTAFYACLLSGQDFSTAMRNAKLKMLSNPLSAFPAKWTGFVLLSSN
jgi:CHAT domain-containing protein